MFGLLGPATSRISENNKTQVAKTRAELKRVKCIIFPKQEIQFVPAITKHQRSYNPIPESTDRHGYIKYSRLPV